MITVNGTPVKWREGMTVNDALKALMEASGSAMGAIYVYNDQAANLSLQAAAGVREAELGGGISARLRGGRAVDGTWTVGGDLRLEVLGNRYGRELWREHLNSRVLHGVAVPHVQGDGQAAHVVALVEQELAVAGIARAFVAGQLVLAVAGFAAVLAIGWVAGRMERS